MEEDIDHGRGTVHDGDVSRLDRREWNDVVVVEPGNCLAQDD